MVVSAIVAAGGHGARFGAGELKQLRVIGGRAVLDRSVSAFVEHPLVAEVIVALPQHLVDDPPPYLRGTPAGKPVRLVAGGARRQDSVANAFRAAAAGSDLIVIHDAARPFVTADVIARTIEAAKESGAAVAALQARDTVKQAELVVRQTHHEGNPNALILSSSKDEQGWAVRETLPRETIFLAQTPQAFRRDVLIAAFELAARTNAEGTDEAALAERAGHTVRLVEGDVSNIKITTPEDLVVATAIAAATERSAEAFALRDSTEGKPVERDGFSRAIRTGRAGTGYDLHRLVAGRPLVIGGITIPSERGALGHSDADVACHAITDAILGAAGLGDIGRHFPDSDPRWKGASSLDLLARAAAMVRDVGLDVGNVDVTVVLEAPKIRDHIAAMRDAIARAIDIEPARVSVKGKTNEGVDAVGRGEAIAAHAIALVRAR